MKSVDAKTLQIACEQAYGHGDRWLVPLWDTAAQALWLTSEQKAEVSARCSTSESCQLHTLPGDKIELPQITLAVPCFNGEQQLRVTVPSLLRQRFPLNHIIIANDGSTDNSRQVIKQYAQQYPAIRLLDLARGNATITRNAIIAQLDDYDFLCWCDCGDELLPDALWTLVNRAVAEQLSGDASVVVLPQRDVRYPDGRITTLRQPSLGKGTAALKRHLTFLNPFSLHQGGLIARKALDAVLAAGETLYDINQQNGPDFLAGTKLLAYGAKVTTLNQSLAIYNIEEDTAELGGQTNKVVARYPDFVKGMDNQSRFFDSHIGNETFKRNAIGCHYYRRYKMLSAADNEHLAQDALHHALTLTPWAKRLCELVKVCDNIDAIVRLYELFDSGESPYLTIEHFDTPLAMHKQITILRRLLTHGEYENRLIAKTLSLVKTYGVDVFFDLGASVGLYAAIVAKHTKVTQIYAYEPTPNHYDLLTRTAKLNNLGRKLQCYPLAVADHTGTMALAISENFGGANRLVDSRYTGTAIDLPELHEGRTMVHYDNVHQVDVVTLDDQHGDLSNKVIYIKIDVEGVEQATLKGASRLLAQNKAVLQVEVAPAQQSHSVNYLDKLGFKHIATHNRDLYFVDKRLL